MSGSSGQEEVGMTRGGEISAAPREPFERELRDLGQELNERSREVVAGMMRRSHESGVVLDRVVEGNFAKVGAVSTVAVARWMAGEGEEAAREEGMESWRIFGQLAAQRAVPLNEVTKRCLRWRDAAEEVVCEMIARRRLSKPLLERAQAMLQRSLDVTLVRMCESFESERRRAQEELDRRQEELAFMATHDALTGLPNRTLILDRLEQMLKRSQRSQTPVAALFIDLDNFKDINDTLGHRVGDSLLCAVAARLEGVLRDVDALGRFGGDEFVVVAEGISLLAGPELIAERMLKALEQPFDLGEEGTDRMVVTASVGVAMGERTTAEELLREADIAMYQAKWSGKNRFVVFQSAMQEAVQSRLELEMDLRDALEREQFYLVYQPTFDLRRIAPTGLEALLRWRHPRRGIVQPEDFVPLLEETGMITEVGGWVLREACCQVVEWRRAGHRVGVAVNVAAGQLEREEFVVEIAETLEQTGLDPEQLTIEITETALMSNAEEISERLARIKRLGVRVAIDDFGTGYSSLAYLQRFPVDALKIDRSFIARLREGPEGETLIRTLIQLGESLSIETLAEGIEHASDLSILRDERCTTGQGFLFARPLNSEDCERFLRESSASELIADELSGEIATKAPDAKRSGQPPSR
jgi:diguanylate cyclase (GGDEF)-like protein